MLTLASKRNEGVGQQLLSVYRIRTLGDVVQLPMIQDSVT